MKAIVLTVQAAFLMVAGLGVLLSAWLLPQTPQDFKWAIATIGVVCVFQVAGFLRLMLDEARR